MVLYTSVSTALKRHVLLRGTCIAGSGITVLVLGGMFIAEPMLKYWGAPLLIICGILVAGGLIPYRRLMRLELNPQVLAIENGDELVYIVKGKKKLSIPLEEIHNMTFFERDQAYGIGVCLKSAGPRNIKVFDRCFDAGEFHANARKRFGCDLFFPYFTKRSWAELQNYL